MLTRQQEPPEKPAMGELESAVIDNVNAAKLVRPHSDQDHEITESDGVITCETCETVLLER